MSRPDQIQKIHVLKAVIGLSDDDYRALLGGMFQGICSSKDLTADDADRLIAKMRGLLPQSNYTSGQWPGRGGKTKYAELGVRPGMATPAQLRMLEAMWAEVSVFDNPTRRAEAFKEFLNARFQVKDVLWVEYKDVSRVVTAIKAMRRQALADAAAKVLGKQRGAA